MKKLGWAVVFLSFTSLFVFGQSRPQRPQGNERVNQRPQPSPSPSPLADKVETEEIVETNEIVDEKEIIKIDTNLVVVPVRVLDRDGRYIPNLKQEDFEVFEDKVSQEIAYFNGVEQPFTVILMLDMSYSTVFKTQEIQNAAIAFTAQLRPNDKVMVVSFDETYHLLCNPTSDRQIVRSAIKKTVLGSGTSLYDTMDYVFSKVEKIQGRKAIVLFTDGVDTTSRKSDYSRNLKMAEETDALIFPVQYDTFSDINRKTLPPPVQIPGQEPEQPSSTRLPPSVQTPLPFPIPLPRRNPVPTQTPNPSPNPNPNPNPSPSGLPGNGTTVEEYERANLYLQSLAIETGGRINQASTSDNMALAFSRIADELRQIYTIGYYPKDIENKKKKRRIRVKVNRPKVAVRARETYILGEK